MKKIFTLILAAMAAISVDAKTKDLGLGNLGSGWSSSYDAATKTITFDGAWTGRGWWIGKEDFSAYKYVVVKFASATDASGKVVIEYGDDGAVTSGDDGMYQPGALYAICPLGALSDQVRQIYIQHSVAGTLTLTDAYLTDAEDPKAEAEAGVEKPATEDLDLGAFSMHKANGDGTYTFPCVDWGSWNNVWYGGRDWSNYSQIVLEFEPTTIAVQLVVQYTEKLNGEENNVKAYVAEGGTQAVIELDPKYKSQVNQIAIQGSGKADVVLKKLYLVRDQATGVDAVKEAAQPAAGKIYSLGGQLVGNGYKGIVIQNGKKYLKK